MKRRSIWFFQRHTQWPDALNGAPEGMTYAGPVASRWSERGGPGKHDVPGHVYLLKVNGLQV
jgi:hypothetical protein